jgi:hypothetical protein
MAVKSETRKRKSKKGRVWEVTYTLVKDIPEKKTAKKTKATKGKAKTAKRKAKTDKRTEAKKTKS